MYARFLSATVSAVSVAEHCRFQSFRYRWYMSGRAINRVEELRHECQVELMQAYMEMRLVANPEPLGRADAVLSSLALLFGCLDRKAGERYDVALDKLSEAQRLMVEACRDDLWYLPQWWHLWRPAWWGAKWRSLRGRKPVAIRGASPPA